MIRFYATGTELVEAHRAYLETNPYQSIFFFGDAPLLKETNHINYAVEAQTEGKTLLAMKVEPYPLLVFGDKEPVPELLAALLDGGYEVKSLLGSEIVCDEMVRIFHNRYGIVYEEALAMDFMEADSVTESSCSDVEVPTEADLDEIVECQLHFVKDCGLEDRVDRERTRSRLDDYRIIRADGAIAAMASFGRATPNSMKIANVYTRPEYRGKGLARKVVNHAKNEILAAGMIATLNVDKKNPVTNHLYRSLGFRPVFSQGEYRRK